jgi:hypothetical protein
MALQLFGPWPVVEFLYPIHNWQAILDGASARRKAATYIQNKRTEISMPRVGFEPTVPVFERTKTAYVYCVRNINKLLQISVDRL